MALDFIADPWSNSDGMSSTDLFVYSFGRDPGSSSSSSSSSSSLPSIIPDRILQDSGRRVTRPPLTSKETLPSEKFLTGLIYRFFRREKEGGGKRDGKGPSRDRMIPSRMCFPRAGDGWHCAARAPAVRPVSTASPIRFPPRANFLDILPVLFWRLPRWNKTQNQLINSSIHLNNNNHHQNKYKTRVVTTILIIIIKARIDSVASYDASMGIGSRPLPILQKIL